MNKESAWACPAERQTFHFFTNAEYIINDEEIICEEPTHFESKSFWNIFNKFNFAEEKSLKKD